MSRFVVFDKEFSDADPVCEAEAVFDLNAAGSWHLQDSSFSLNTCGAIDIDRDRVAVPVDGRIHLNDLQTIAKVNLRWASAAERLRYFGQGLAVPQSP